MNKHGKQRPSTQADKQTPSNHSLEKVLLLLQKMKGQILNYKSINGHSIH